MRIHAAIAVICCCAVSNAESLKIRRFDDSPLVQGEALVVMMPNAWRPGMLNVEFSADDFFVWVDHVDVEYNQRGYTAYPARWAEQHGNTWHISLDSPTADIVPGRQIVNVGTMDALVQSEEAPRIRFQSEAFGGYLSNRILVDIVAASEATVPECPGSADLTLDGQIDATDFDVLAAAFGEADGDIDCNGTTDLQDFIALREQYLGQEVAAEPIPEPTAWMLALTAMLLFVSSGRRREIRNSGGANGDTALVCGIWA